MSLSLIIQTRDRTDLLRYTLEKTLPNIKRDDTKVLICVDDDDVLTKLKMEDKFFPKDPRIIWSVKKREDSRGEKYDRALTLAPASLYLPSVDCAPFTTPGFDQIFLDAAALYPDGIGCVYTPMANASFPGILAITHKLVAKLGHIYSHDFPFWFIDHELDDIARMIGRYTTVDVKFETGLTRPTKTIRMWDLAFWTGYFNDMTMDRRAAAQNIILGDDFETPRWLKFVLLGAYHPIEARSYWINNNVRSQAAEIEAQRGETGPRDEGYLRAKARAEKRLDLKHGRQAAA